MSTLTGNQIRNTYDSLLKLEDNDGLTANKKKVTDGLGNETPLLISETEIVSSVNVEASGFKTPTGTSSQVLLADGSTTTLDVGSTQEIFKNVAVSGQSTIVADSNNDTLTFVEGSNVTLTTDDATDSITIASSYVDTTYTAGAGLDLTGTVFSHEDTSSVTDLTPSSRTYVDGITFDDYGHVQSISTSSETLTGTVDGSGTANHVAKWSDSDTITDSIIYDDGTNVGIGTASPNRKLVVAGEVGDFKTTGHQIFLTRDGNNEIYAVGASSVLALGQNGSEKMRIHSDGNVGIGTVSPAQKLQVNGIGEFAGALRITETGTSQNILIGNQDSGGINTPAMINGVNGSLRFGKGNSWSGEGGTFTETMRVDSSGNVGIGTTSPAQKLDVNGAIAVKGKRVVHRDNNITYLGSVDTGDSVRFRADGSDKMTIDTSGKVGIGTTSPNEELHISSVNPGVRLQDTDGTNTFGRVHFTGSAMQYHSRNDTSNGVHSWYGSNGTADTEFMRLRSDGKLRLLEYGSGTFTGTATQRLGVDSSGNIIEIPIGSGAVDGSGTANYVTKWTDADTITDSVIYDDGTNVGIGTTSPNHLLDVEKAGASARVYNLTSDGNTDLYLTTTGTTGASRLLFGDTADNDIGKIIYRNNGDSMAFETNAGERMRITSTGNVGIGTTSPGQKTTIFTSNESLYDVLGVYNNVTGTSALGKGAAIRIGGSTTGSYSTKIATIYEGNNPSFLQPALAFFTMNNTYLKGSEVERMRISANGNVGIGATSPSAKLHIEGDGSIIRLQNNNSDANGTFIDFRDSTGTRTGYLGTTGASDDMFIFTQASKPIRFFTNATERARISENGNVGIGTTSPSVNLHVESATSAQFKVGNGTQFVRLYADADEATILADGSVDMRFYTGGSEKMRIDTSGNVGIGTTSPQKKLDVYLGTNDAVASIGGTISSGEYAGLHFGYSETGNSLYRHSAIVFERDDSAFGDARGKIHLLNSASGSASADLGDARLTILPNGNVGIGTTSPGDKLQVAGNAIIQDYAYIGDGVQHWGDGGTGMNFPANDTIDLATSSTPRIRINSVGDVGIGTTSPSQRLHVSGNLRVTGAYYDSNNSAGTSGQVLSSTATGTDWVSLSEISGVDGTGTANTIAMWSDADTITNAPITISGNDATFAGDVTVGPKSNATVQVSESGGATVKMLAGSVGRIGTYTDDELRIVTDGNDRLTISNTGAATFAGVVAVQGTGDSYFTGNVGIGTTSPASKLTVSGDANVTAKFAIGIAAVHPTIDFYNQGTAYFNGSTTVDDNLIVTNGNVGIGTTSPSEKLVVNGPIVWQGSLVSSKTSSGALDRSGNDLRIRAYGATAGTGNLVFRTGGGGGSVDSEAMRITSSGNVGIGTASPEGKLHIYQPSGAGPFLITRGTDKTGVNLQALVDSTKVRFNAYGDALTFFTAAVGSGTNASEKMRITSGGNVGIGTTSPSQKLHVAGNARITGAIYDGANTAGTSGQILSSTGTETEWIDAPSGATIDGSGVAGAITKWTDSDSIEDSDFITESASGVQFGTDALTYVASTKRIGINTSSPSVAFDCAGAAKFQSSFYDGSNNIASSGKVLTGTAAGECLWSDPNSLAYRENKTFYSSWKISTSATEFFRHTTSGAGSLGYEALMPVPYDGTLEQIVLLASASYSNISIALVDYSGAVIYNSGTISLTANTAYTLTPNASISKSSDRSVAIRFIRPSAANNGEISITATYEWDN